jgi:hypothetical protein
MSRMATVMAPPRALTPAEKTFFTRILGTIERALPPAPERWAATEKPSTAPPKDVAEGSEKGAFMVRYNGQWFDQSQREWQSRIPADLATLQQEQQEAMAEMMQASQSRDRDGMKRAKEKLMAIQQRSLPSFPTKRTAVSDACLQVRVTVNDFAVGLKNAVPLSLPGVSRAFAVDDGNPDMRDCPYGKTVVLLGAWDNGRAGGEYTYFRSNWREGMPHPSAKNMILEVRASDQRAKAYLQAVQWDVLKGLLAQ